MKFLAVFFFILTLKSTYGMTVLSSCPDIKPAENANINDVSKGRWYVLKVYSTSPPPNPPTCILTDSFPTDDPNKFKVFNLGKSNGMTNNVSLVVTVQKPGIVYFDGDLEAPAGPNGETQKFHTSFKVRTTLF